jgi:ribosomal-protein-alanine N-acetyltransferase
VWGHHQIVERTSGLVVGGVGFFGPPDAVRLLTALGWTHGAREISAQTDLANRASQRVLEKVGFQRLSETERRTHQLNRPR